MNLKKINIYRDGKTVDISCATIELYDRLVWLFKSFELRGVVVIDLIDIDREGEHELLESTTITNNQL